MFFVCAFLFVIAPAFAQPLSGTGLTAIYWDNLDLSGSYNIRLDQTINFDWRRGSPIPNIDGDTFSVLWFGWIEPPASATYTFYTEADDGVRLIVNEQQIIDEWRDGRARERRGNIRLEAGRLYPIRLYFYENGGDASVKLYWSSANLGKQIILTNYLHPGDPAQIISGLPTWTPTTSPTPSDTPTATSTPTATLTPTNTFTPTATFTPTLTHTPSATPTATPMTYEISASSSSINARQCPQLTCEVVRVLAANDQISVSEIVEGDVVSGSNLWLRLGTGNNSIYIHSSLAAQVIPPTPTPPINTSNTTTYYVNSTGRVNIRRCASTNCEIIAGADRGDAIRVLDTEGDWQRIVLPDNRIGYIATSLTSRSRPPALPTAAPRQPQQPPAPQVQPPTSQPISTPVAPPPIAPQFTCNCSKTCEQMVSCEEAYFQLNQCGCRRRDADNDGVPCENMCPGG